MGAALVGNNFLLILWKFHVAWQKKVTCRSLKFTMCREVKAGNERPQGGRQGNQLLDFLGPQTQGSHATLKIQVS